MKNVYGRIYIITNQINQKQYIGLTTKSLEERFHSHYYRACNEKSVIQKAMKLYGKEKFTIEELDIAYSEEELFEKEVRYIAEYNTYLGRGYNQTAGGGGITNMSQEIRNKISKTKTGKKVPKLQGLKRSNKDRLHISRQMGSKPVRGVHRDTREVIYLDYVTKGKELGFNPSLICAVIKGKRNHHKGYIFEYVDNANPDLPTESNNSVAVQRIGTETESQNIMSPRDRDS